MEAYAQNLTELIKILQMESEVSVKWLENNEMIANRKKFQSTILHKTYFANLEGTPIDKQSNNNI